MRLIDADALKEKLKPCEADVCEFSCEGCHFRVVTAEDIDNAPTVESYTSDDLVKYISATEDLVREKLERPQGEWIYPEKTDKAKGFGGYCSNCKCDMPIFIEDWKQKYCETKYCPNCGAEMRKGGAE